MGECGGSSRSLLSCLAVDSLINTRKERCRDGKSTLGTSAWLFPIPRERSVAVTYVLAFCGNLSLWGPDSGRELHYRNRSFHSWMPPGGDVGRTGAEEAGLGLFLLRSLSLRPPPAFSLQDHIPVPYQPDSSSNPSSTTSSTPSSPAPPLPPSATPPSPLHPSPQCTRQQKTFNLPGTSVLGEAGGVGFMPGSLGGTLEGMWSESYMQDTCHT